MVVTLHPLPSPADITTTIRGQISCQCSSVFPSPPQQQHHMDSETNLTTAAAGEEEEAVLTQAELEVVMAVFKSFETGVREATIYPKVF